MCPLARPQSTQDPERLDARWTTAFWIFAFFFGLALAVIVFRTPYELWDESRYANNALEMVLSRNWMVLHYAGTTDRWITEPPALIWVFASLLRAGAKLPYAIRIPGLLSGLLTTVAIYIAADRILHRRFVAIAGSLIFLSSMLFFGPHVVLNGDFDAPLCLLITVGALSLWAFFNDIHGAGTYWIALSAFMLFASVMTKGFAGLQLLPGYLLYALIEPAARRRLADKRLWLSLLCALGLCAVYYVSRNRVDPDYWQRVLRNEVLGRVGSAIEGHVGGPLFHVKQMATFFEPGFLLTLVAMVPLGSGWAKDRRSFSLSLFCVVVALTTIILLSLSKTKLPYYTVNTEPLLSLFAAIGLADALRQTTKGELRFDNFFSVEGVALTLLFLFATATLGLTFVRTAHRRRSPDMLRFVSDNHVITEAAMHHATLVVLEPEIAGTPFSPHYQPYGQLVLNEAALLDGQHVLVLSNTARLQGSPWIVSCEKTLYEPLIQARRLTVLRTDGTCIAGPMNAQD